MNASHRPTRSYRPSILLYLFLATFWTSNCLASASSENDLLYNGILSSDIGTTLDSAILESHEFNLVTRQSNESVLLSDNSIVPKDINPGTTDFWTFSPSSLNISGSPTLYITISACTQPFPKVGLNATQVYASETLPSLQLYISTDSSNPKPGPDSDTSLQTMQNLSQGFTNVTLSSLSDDVYISVVAENITSKWQGSWSYQLATSTKGMKYIYRVNDRTSAKYR